MSETVMSTGGSEEEKRAEDAQASTAGPSSDRAAEEVKAPLTPLERIRGWRQDYQNQVGLTPLENVSQLAAQMDLTHAHPSGIAQLFASGQVHLDALFRDRGMLRAAHRRMERVLDDQAAKERASGFAQLSMVVGVAAWQGRDMPVLLYPVRIDESTQGASRASIRFTGKVDLNPALISAMRERGITLDPDRLFSASHYQGGTPETSSLFKDMTALITPHISDFTIERKIVLGCFIEPSAQLLGESLRILDRMTAGSTGNDLLDALAGDQAASERLRGGPVPDYSPFDADPHSEFEAGDVDNRVRYAAQLVATGHSVLVDEQTGRHSADDALAIASRCVTAGRTVLYVPCVVEEKRRFQHRLDSTGMADMALDLTDDQLGRVLDQRLIDAVGFKPGKASEHFDQVADELVGVRSRLTRYLGDLHGVDSSWGVSAYQTIQNLANIANMPTHPATRVRLGAATAHNLQPELDAWADKLERAAELGEFVIGPQDTPWFGAALVNENEAVDAYSRVVRLLQRLLPDTREQVKSTVETCGFPVPATVKDWGRQVVVLKNLRRVLDVFQPSIFERDIPAMIEATKSKADRKANGTNLGFWERRRLVKEAKSLLRPGAQVEDLHESLVVVSKQAEQWRTFVPHGGWPVLPPKLDVIIDTQESLIRDMTALDTVLATTPAGGDLETMDLNKVEERLKALFDDHTALDTLPERCALEGEFNKAGLQDLVQDLRNRQVEGKAVRAELQLAWWTTVFDDIMRSSQIISNQDGSALSNAADRFSQVDAQHVASVGPMVAQESEKRLSELLFSRTQEANQLHTMLAGSPGAALAVFQQAHPGILSAAKPIIIATPATLATRTNPTQLADTVIIDAGAHMPSIQVLTVLARARQVAVIAHRPTITSDGLVQLVDHLVPVTVKARPSRRSIRLDAFLKDHGYGELSAPVPDCREPGRVTLTRVEGAGVPVMATGLVESSQQEVAAVVNMLKRKAGSFSLVPNSYLLTVVTLSATHRSRLGAELKSAAAKDRVFAKFLRHVRIVGIDEVCGARATDVILTLGFAKTTHGRLLQQFGDLEGEGGKGMLLDALVLPDRNLDIVAAFSADDLEDDRIHQPGPRLLKDLLTWVEHPDVEPARPEQAKQSTNVLFRDLAQRLRTRGLDVALDYGYDQAPRIPLVVGLKNKPYALAVLTDDAEFMHTQSTRERHRFTTEDLQYLGWSVMTVWSVSAFVNPDKEADRIVARLADIYQQAR